VVSSTPRPHFTPGRDPVPILQEAGWAPRPVWTGRKSHPHRDLILDRPACIQSLYRLSYPAYRSCMYVMKMQVKISSETTSTFALVLDNIVNCIILPALQYICYMQQQNTCMFDLKLHSLHQAYCPPLHTDAVFSVQMLKE
jgi:hypothetical protein